MTQEKWTMPEWMEPYREHFTNTGGNTVEKLMNWNGRSDVNLPMAFLQIAVIAQVGLLMRLYDKGQLN